MVDAVKMYTLCLSQVLSVLSLEPHGFLKLLFCLSGASLVFSLPNLIDSISD